MIKLHMETSLVTFFLCAVATIFVFEIQPSQQQHQLQQQGPQHQQVRQVINGNFAPSRFQNSEQEPQFRIVPTFAGPIHLVSSENNDRGSPASPTGHFGPFQPPRPVSATNVHFQPVNQQISGPPKFNAPPSHHFVQPVRGFQNVQPQPQNRRPSPHQDSRPSLQSFTPLQQPSRFPAINAIPNGQNGNGGAAPPQHQVLLVQQQSSRFPASNALPNGQNENRGTASAQPPPQHQVLLVRQQSSRFPAGNALPNGQSGNEGAVSATSQQQMLLAQQHERPQQHQHQQGQSTNIGPPAVAGFFNPFLSTNQPLFPFHHLAPVQPPQRFFLSARPRPSNVAHHNTNNGSPNVLHHNGNHDGSPAVPLSPSAITFPGNSQPNFVQQSPPRGAFQNPANGQQHFVGGGPQGPPQHHFQEQNFNDRPNSFPSFTIPSQSSGNNQESVIGPQGRPSSGNNLLPTAPQRPPLSPLAQEPFPQRAPLSPSAQHPSAQDSSPHRAPLSPPVQESSTHRAPLSPPVQEPSPHRAPLSPSVQDSSPHRAPLRPSEQELSQQTAPLSPPLQDSSPLKVPLTPPVQESSQERAPLGPAKQESFQESTSLGPAEQESFQESASLGPAEQESSHERVPLGLVEQESSMQMGQLSLAAQEQSPQFTRPGPSRDATPFPGNSEFGFPSRSTEAFPGFSDFLSHTPPFPDTTEAFLRERFRGSTEGFFEDYPDSTEGFLDDGPTQGLPNDRERVPADKFPGNSEEFPGGSTEKFTDNTGRFPENVNDSRRRFPQHGSNFPQSAEFPHAPISFFGHFRHFPAPAPPPELPQTFSEEEEEFPYDDDGGSEPGSQELVHHDQIPASPKQPVHHHQQQQPNEEPLTVRPQEQDTFSPEDFTNEETPTVTSQPVEQDRPDNEFHPQLQPPGPSSTESNHGQDVSGPVNNNWHTTTKTASLTTPQRHVQQRPHHSQVHNDHHVPQEVPQPNVQLDLPLRNGHHSPQGGPPSGAHHVPQGHPEDTSNTDGRHDQRIDSQVRGQELAHQSPGALAKHTSTKAPSFSPVTQHLAQEVGKGQFHAPSGPTRQPQSPSFVAILNNLRQPPEEQLSRPKLPRVSTKAPKLTTRRLIRLRRPTKRVRTSTPASLQELSTDAQKPPKPVDRTNIHLSQASISPPVVGSDAKSCNPDLCQLPNCFCGGNKQIPGNLKPSQVPQMVLLTFDDSVNEINYGFYSSLLNEGRKNPNGCSILGTFYVSHEWTDYAKIQTLYALGHEIASHSISHSDGAPFSKERWIQEIDGQKQILSALGGVKLPDVKGMRAPFLQGGGNKQFAMLYEKNFTYDSSIPAHLNKPPTWPYTLDYRMPHECGIPPCPTKSFPGVWEVPMVMWEDLNGGRCAMADACQNPSDARGVYDMLVKNFKRHYTSNRAPFGMFYHYAWFTHPHHQEGFLAFVDALNQLPDVYFVTNSQMIEWMRNPTPLERINSFQPWQCDKPLRAEVCSKPKKCTYRFKGEERQIPTCRPCPQKFPWLQTYTTLEVTL